MLICRVVVLLANVKFAEDGMGWRCDFRGGVVHDGLPFISQKISRPPQFHRQHLLKMLWREVREVTVARAGEAFAYFFDRLLWPFCAGEPRLQNRIYASVP
jgi:hypothetical protein